MGKDTAVFAIFDRTGAESAVAALKREGFRNSDISCLFADNIGTKAFAHEKQTKAPEGATTGALAGAALGGALGWLGGFGTLAIPAFGPLLAIGPIVAALAGIGVGGALGGLTGGLIGAGIPEYEAKRYESLLREGNVLLSVHCDKSEWTRKAKNILEQQGGRDISSASEAKVPPTGIPNNPYTGKVSDQIPPPPF